MAKGNERKRFKRICFACEKTFYSLYQTRSVHVCPKCEKPIHMITLLAKVREGLKEVEDMADEILIKVRGIR